ncbi:hypothetical protein [Chryseobacterium luteum]|uniref:Uncharacterized protein n=1 Tax=Chryseobacterium luteum TaxID=421531 RepID=A0A085ZCT9_9FLAO|nr:hypothetical protein [Chryseobacterium luteum]KFF02253.1 hypothetical protein IX38_13565 [Chryseobacterium luteum]
MEETGNIKGAAQVFLQAWNKASDDFEKFISAWFIARLQKDDPEKINWYEIAEWLRQTPKQIQQWQDKLTNNKGDIIN